MVIFFVCLSVVYVHICEELKKINARKTKPTIEATNGKVDTNHHRGPINVEQVTSYMYLGAVIEKQVKDKIKK